MAVARPQPRHERRRRPRRRPRPRRGSASGAAACSSSAVSIPSRPIISSVNRKTPSNARRAGPHRCSTAGGSSISPFIRRPVRHMWTVTRCTGAGRHERKGPFEPFLVGGVVEQVAAGRADHDGGDDAPVDGRARSRAPALAQVGQADGDDQEGFEPFAEGDDERLQHVGFHGETETQSQNDVLSLLPANPTGQVGDIWPAPPVSTAGEAVRRCVKLKSCGKHEAARRRSPPCLPVPGDRVAGAAGRRSSPARRSSRCSPRSPTRRSGSCRTSSQDDFEVFDNDKPQPLVFFDNEMQPITVVVMLDTSGSMTLTIDAAQGGRRAVRQLRLLPADQAARRRVQRQDRVQRRGSRTIATTGHRHQGSRLRQRHASLGRARGEPRRAEGHRGTARHPRVHRRRRHGQPRRSLGKVIDRARAEEVMIYAIGLESQYFDGSARCGRKPDRGLRKTRRRNRRRLLRAEEDRAISRPTFTRVAQELHSQYVLGFTPTMLDGKVHKLARAR